MYKSHHISGLQHVSILYCLPTLEIHSIERLAIHQYLKITLSTCVIASNVDTPSAASEFIAGTSQSDEPRYLGSNANTGKQYSYRPTQVLVQQIQPLQPRSLSYYQQPATAQTQAYSPGLRYTTAQPQYPGSANSYSRSRPSVSTDVSYGRQPTDRYQPESAHEQYYESSPDSDNSSPQSDILLDNRFVAFHMQRGSMADTDLIILYSRYLCVHPGCGSGFARVADLQRHIARRHAFCPQLFPCPIPGCNRAGSNGLPRPDKLRDHLREKHKLEIPKMQRKGST
jgi:hypothetical protein